jgi:ankyrin repeat protein
MKIISINLIRGKDESGSTPLHYLASPLSADAIAAEILKRGRETNADAIYCVDNSGSLPIHVAAGHGRLDIITRLLEECPDCVCSHNSSGQTFLHVAVQRERTDVVTYVVADDGTWIPLARRAMAPFMHSVHISLHWYLSCTCMYVSFLT